MLLNIINSSFQTYNKMKRFEVLMNLLISGEKICKKLIYNRNSVISPANHSERTKEDSLPDTKNNSRKAKRRTKALKAKIAKVKTAELTERLNSTSTRRALDPRETEITSPKEDCDVQNLYEHSTDFQSGDEKIPILSENECDIVNSIKKNLLIGLESESQMIYEQTEQKFSYARYDWKNKILSMPFNVKPKVYVNNIDSYEEDFYLKPDDLSIFTAETSNSAELRGESLEALLYPTMRYLKLLLNKVINKYQKYWIIDYQLEKEVEENSGKKNFGKYTRYGV